MVLVVVVLVQCWRRSSTPPPTPPVASGASICQRGGVLRGKRKSELLKSKVILQRQQPAGKHFAKMFEVISDGQCDGEIVRIMQ